MRLKAGLREIGQRNRDNTGYVVHISNRRNAKHIPKYEKGVIVVAKEDPLLEIAV